jgi:hypothetical protein
MKAEVTEKEEKMKTIKLGAMFLVSMLALAGTGAAYALWFEDLYIYTDIYTGDVDVEWSVVGYGSNQQKPVSTFNIYIDPDYPEVLRCFIYDAYPCVEYYFWFDLHCVGSIPVHFTPMDFIAGTLDEAWIDDYAIFIDRIVWNDGDTTVFDYPGIPIEYIQLHQGDVAYGYYMIHFNNDLPQDDYFTFDFTTRAHQYNELDWGPGAGG